MPFAFTTIIVTTSKTAITAITTTIATTAFVAGNVATNICRIHRFSFPYTRSNLSSSMFGGGDKATDAIQKGADVEEKMALTRSRTVGAVTKQKVFPAPNHKVESLSAHLVDSGKLQKFEDATEGSDQQTTFRMLRSEFGKAHASGETNEQIAERILSNPNQYGLTGIQRHNSIKEEVEDDWDHTGKLEPKLSNSPATTAATIAAARMEIATTGGIPNRAGGGKTRKKARSSSVVIPSRSKFKKGMALKRFNSLDISDVYHKQSKRAIMRYKKVVDAADLHDHHSSDVMRKTSVRIISAELHQLISTAMRSFFYMSPAMFDNMHQIVESMVEVQLDAGEFLMRQGDDGEDMFVLQSGLMAVSVDGNEVAVVKSGGVVGELALLYSEPRAASVEAVSKCTLWSLSRMEFQLMQARAKMSVRSEISRYLNEAKAFENINTHGKSKLGEAFFEVTFKDGEVITAEDTPEGICYLLKSGTVSIISSIETAEELKQFAFPSKTEVKDGVLVAFSGCFIGGHVLLGVEGQQVWHRNTARNATDNDQIMSRVTMTANGYVECWSFTVGQFVSILGPVEETLSLGVQNGFGLRRVMSSMPGSMNLNGSFRGRRRLSVECSTTGKERDLGKSDFEEVAFLGKGGYGRVVLAECSCKESAEFGKQYALKAMSKQMIVDGKQIQHVTNEKNLLNSLKHNFVLGLLTTFQDESAVYLVTDYIQSISLWEVIYVEKTGLLSMQGQQHADCCRFWAAGTTEAICYLHTKGIAFRDLKPENLLVDQNGYLMLIDLGFAKALPYKVTKKDGTVVTEDRTYTLCGTIEYLAPELFFDGHGHDQAVDYWALGCVVFELVQGHTPFVEYPGEQNMHKVLQRICMMKFNPLRFPNDFDKKAGGPECMVCLGSSSRKRYSTPHASYSATTMIPSHNPDAMYLFTHRFIFKSARITPTTLTILTIAYSG
mmetsp:Transcript_43405/g.117694  ORF Transcript_43405/g.117694 Transcript_43405/m.117694 type:complete len:947 (+) Transcript_43405:489-3329(+)